MVKYRKRYSKDMANDGTRCSKDRKRYGKR